MSKKVVSIYLSEEADEIVKQILRYEKEINKRSVSYSSVVDSLIKKYGQMEVDKLREIKKEIMRLREEAKRAQDKIRKIILDFNDDSGWEVVEDWEYADWR